MPSIQYTSTVTAFHAKPVRCANCGQAYLYDMKAQGSGQGVAPNGEYNYEAQVLATRRALDAADEKLAEAIDLVPCPTCGCYQPDMVALIKQKHLRWVGTLGGLLLLGTFTLFGIGFLGQAESEPEPYLVGGFALAGLGIALILLRRTLARRYDPNAGDPEPRKQLGQSRAYRPDDSGRLTEDRDNQIAADRCAETSEKQLGWATALGLLGLAALGVAVWVGWFGVGQLLNAADSRDWPTAKGQIFRADKTIKNKNKTEQVIADIGFTYQVGEITYTSRNFWFGVCPDNDPALRQYSSGMPVTVHYYPSNPSVAVLQPGPRSPHSYTLSVIAGIALAVALLCLGVARNWYCSYQEFNEKVTRCTNNRWRTAPTFLPPKCL